MIPEFQKIIDNVLHKTKNTLTFIDEIFIVTNGRKEENLRIVEESNKVIDETAIRLKREKCKIAIEETEWLGQKLSAEGIKP